MTTQIGGFLRGWAKKVKSDPAFRCAVVVFLVMRVVISLWMALVLAVTRPPTTPDDILRPYQGVEPITGGAGELFVGVWQRFDTLWYLRTATHGYSAAVSDIHFPPLYPLLIKVLGTIFLNNYLVAAIAISNIAYVLALIYLYKLTAEMFGTRTARRGALYLSVFPTSFFLIAPYSESLFLLLAVAAFYYLARKRWLLVGFLGFLAVLTRLPALALFPPLLYEYLRQGDYRIRWFWRDLTGLLLIPLGAALYLCLRYLVGGTPVLPASEPKLFARLAPPWENVTYAIRTLASGSFHQADLFNLAFTLLFVALLILSWRRFPLSYHFYTIGTLILLTTRLVETQPLNSMSRYVLAIFPIFMYLGILGRDRRLHRYILYPSVATLLYLSGQFAMWGWVA
ncbi:MAG: hypothetical protein GTO63_10445 [Anaerolineae bacterium]|nr:hypothetical protein [Anaerolineae bacterium]NIN95322.1 hypothetical protein [Anaerolineae bacterium]NIQ78286.1 hypothetical protein [Anaerolineae bacterium]